jgi:hypothetical protein
MRSDPKTILLPTWFCESWNLARLLAEDGRFSWAEGYRLLERFEMRSHERAFARAVLTRRTNLWLYRTNQRESCGDFVAVDMSAPQAENRRAYVIELKSGEPLVIGGARLQLASYRSALLEIAEQRAAITAKTPVELLYGDTSPVLAHLGAVMP